MDVVLGDVVDVVEVIKDVVEVVRDGVVGVVVAVDSVVSAEPHVGVTFTAEVTEARNSTTLLRG